MTFARLLIVGLLLISSSGFAQELLSGEYFWNDDPGVGMGEPFTFTQADQILESLDISSAGLSEGTHLFSCRIFDENGAVTHLTRTMVIIYDEVISPVSNFEYFWDHDPGAGNGIPVTVIAGDQVSVEATVSAEGIDEGIHYLGTRFKDELGRWSHLSRHLIIIESEQIIEVSALEYFWDSDPGTGLGTPVDIDDLEIFQGDIEVSADGLELGEHLLQVRFLDLEGNWSHYYSEVISICTNYAPVSDYAYQQNGLLFVLQNNSEFVNDYSWELNGNEISTLEAPIITVSDNVVNELCLITTNECHADTLCHLIGAPFLTAIEPSVMSNTGFFTPELTGFGFEGDVMVEFRNETDSIVADTTYVQGLQWADSQFALDAETTGFWDVRLTLEDGTVLEIPDGVELVDFEGEDLIGAEVELLQPGAILVEAPVPSSPLARNEGLEDFLAVPFIMTHIPESINLNWEPESYALDEDPYFADLFQYLNDNLMDYYMPYEFGGSTDEEQFFGLVIPHLGIGEERFFQGTISNSELGEYALGLYLHPNGFLKTEAFTEDLITPTQCMFEIVLGAFNLSLEGPIVVDDFDSCFESGFTTMQTFLRDKILEDYQADYFYPMQGLMSNLLFDMVGCMDPSYELSEQEMREFSREMTLMLGNNLIIDEDFECEDYATVAAEFRQVLINGLSTEETVIPSVDRGDGGVMGGYRFCTGCATCPPTDVVGSMDPNDKYGPLDIEQGLYVNGTETMDYSIFFENNPEATANASLVLVIDTLDSDVFNLNSFEFEYVSWGDTIIYINDATHENVLLIDLQPDLNALLKIEALFDAVTGEAQWIFRTLNPQTFEPQYDPENGFLPPNISSPEGMGFVTFSVDLLDGIETGTAILNDAAIYFDFNDVIETQEWFNEFDNTPPESDVQVPGEFTTETTFQVEWESVDPDDAIHHYDLYYKVNDAEDWILWIPGTTDLESEFTGVLDSTYHFLSLATDSAFNFEPVPDEPDASITIIPTDINELVLEQSIVIGNPFPNPNSGEFQVELLAMKSESIAIQLMDVTGRLVQQSAFQCRPGRNVLSTNISHLATGNYIMRFGNDRLSESRYIIIN